MTAKEVHLIVDLLIARRKRELSKEEQLLLDSWVSNNPATFEAINDDESILSSLRDAHLAAQRIEQKIRGSVPEWTENDQLVSIGRQKARQFTIRGWLSAAAIVGILLTGALYFYLSKAAKSQNLQTSPLAAVHDILPGNNKAILTLGNGKTISLNTAVDGNLATDGNASIAKLDSGHLAYSLINAPSVLCQYNTLTTPRAGQFEVTLPDGTEVWLNNASSLHYPTSFSGPTREVTLAGEAYFEVSKNKEKPFIVHAGTSSVRILGTSFNVNSYTDEEIQRITLVEGSVIVSNTETSIRKVLKPGEQARISLASSEHNIAILKHMDTDEVIAWKKGYFHFFHTALPDALRQLARWYDVEVEYIGRPTTQSISGKIERDLPLAEILKQLSDEQINFRIENRKIIVSP